MASVYNRGKFLLGNGLNLATADLRVVLVTSGYVFNADHNFLSDVIASELAGGNYVRKSLASKTWTENDAADRADFDAADTVWISLLALAGTPAAAIIFRFVTVDADSDLLCFNDLSPVTPPSGGDYTVAWDALGILSGT